MKQFKLVTESPGQGATCEQLSMMMTRYSLAKGYSIDKDVLEIACGSGTALGYLSSVAKSVVGGDIDQHLLKIACINNQGDLKISVKLIDALSIEFPDSYFDTIIFFEAIYYLDNVNKLVEECLRVLRPNGTILISTVNCEWHGFNASPFSTRYLKAEELINLFPNSAGVSLLMSFLDLPRKSNYFISLIRRIAISFNMVPRTMKGKQLLKRIFYGKLTKIPIQLYDGLGKVNDFVEYKDHKNKIKNFKQLYLIINK
jgi:SAM-dependent methyltransferase